MHMPKLRRLGVSFVAILLVGSLVPLGIAAGTTTTPPSTTTTFPSCPWVGTDAMTLPPVVRAQQLVRAMSIGQQVRFLNLVNAPDQENVLGSIAQLCVPRMVLEDGPNGNIASGGYALPASISTAATFNPNAAFDYGVALGAAATLRGETAVQGPVLNLALAPTWGRNAETFGEDPFLAGVLGTAEVNGVQSTGTQVIVKHAGVYPREANREAAQYLVSTRALHELYDAPFATTIAKTDPLGIMCAYGSVNGVNQCSDPSLRNRMAAAGFSGFIRTDSGAVQDPIAALIAGPTLFKPSQTGAMFAALDSGQLTPDLLALRTAQVATVLFQRGLFDRPRTPVRASGPTPEELSAGQEVSSQSLVLLKNTKVLPIGPTTSIAAIGAAASLSPSYGIGGSSFVAVHQPTTFTQALINQFGPRNVTVEPATPKEPVTSFIPSAKQPGVVTTTSTFTAPSSGPYLARLNANSGTAMARVSIDGRGRGAILVQNSTGIQRTSWVQGLSAGPHLITIRWASTGAPPTFTLQGVASALTAAANAARAVTVPVVFVGVPSSESYDADTLNLPDFQDLLISTVASVNPRTVVVLESPRPIAMPWLSQVAGVLDAFYVGQSGGTATARALAGVINPSGHLPFTFPTSLTASPFTSPSVGANANGVQSLIGNDGIGMSFGMHALGGTPPLFPFGFGLSYTTFTESALTATVGPTGITALVTVTNVGTVAGRAVVQAYLTYPTGLGEPSRQLKAIGQAYLQPGASAKIPLVIPNSLLTIWPNGQPILPSGRLLLETGWSASSLPLAAPLNLENSAIAHRAAGALRG